MFRARRWGGINTTMNVQHCFQEFKKKIMTYRISIILPTFNSCLRHLIRVTRIEGVCGILKGHVQSPKELKNNNTKFQRVSENTK